jgi:serine/threonine-protein kinase
MTTGPLGVIAQYNLLERLEPAGPGDLFRARDTHRGRTVALRLLPEAFTPDAAAREALLARARTLIPFSHPNVTTLFDAGEHERRVFLVFEFLSGQPLRVEMAGRAMNVRRAVEIAVQIADAVAAAHAAGFVHGGLSPDSVVITARGHTKVPAFELAARSGFDEVDGEVRLRDYDSPEEARGEKADERSDIYSIGAVLYEMVTTRRPMHRGASAPSASNPHVPKELDDIVLKAVAPNPDLRMQSAAVLAAELRGMAAILETRGGAGDDEEEGVEAAARISPIAIVAILIVVALALVVWLTRS